MQIKRNLNEELAGGDQKIKKDGERIEMSRPRLLKILNPRPLTLPSQVLSLR